MKDLRQEKMELKRSLEFLQNYMGAQKWGGSDKKHE